MRSHFPIVELGKCVRQISQRNRADTDVEVFSVTNSEGFTKSTTYFSKEVFSKDISNYKVVRPGQFAYNPSRINVGSIDYLRHTSPVLVSPLYVVFESDKDVHADYLLRYLKSNWGNAQIRANTEGAVRDSLKFKGLESIKIPLPSVNDQMRIAHLLGKVEGLIVQRKQHLQQLDDLLTSVFLEMFGDIRAQKSHHPWTVLRPYLKANSGKSSKSIISDKETGIPIFGGNGVNGWAIKALYETPVIIAGRVGQQCGVIHVSKGPCWVTDNAIVLSISDDAKLNIVYLAKAFHYAPIRERVKQLDLPFINQSMLLDYPLPLPPIDLQNQFAAIVEKFESIKSNYQKSLTNLEALYGALSQQAFKGELDLSRVPLPDEQVQPTHGEHDEEQGQADRSPLAVEAITPTEVINYLMQAEQLQGRSELLARWLKQYLTNTSPDASLGSAQFLESAWQTLQEAQLETDGETSALTLDDYDAFKDLVFKALASGELNQTFDGDSNRVALQKRPVNWNTW